MLGANWPRDLERERACSYARTNEHLKGQVRGTCELLSSNFPFFSSLEGPHKSVFTSTAVSFLFLISELLQELEGQRKETKKRPEKGLG